ncbi:MAG: PAS domain S-box protein [Pseudomonadota bacterium]
MNKKKKTSKPGDELKEAHKKQETLDNATSELWKAQEALKESEGRLKNVLASVEDLIFVFDTEGRYASYHTAAREQLYRPPEELIGRKYSDVLPPAVGRQLDEAIKKNRLGETAGFDYSLDISGSAQWFSARISPIIRDGGYDGSVAIVRNVTEQRRLAQELEKGSDKYFDLYENAPIAHCSVGTDGIIRRFNRMMTELVGYSNKDLAGMHVFDLYDKSPEGKGRAKQVFERYKKGEVISSEELLIRRSDGSPVWVSLSVSPVMDDDGNVVESRSMAVDITDRKRAEQDLLESEQTLRALYQGIPVPIYTWQLFGGKFNLIDYNDAAAASALLDAVERMGEPFEEIFRESPEIIDDFNRCAAGKGVMSSERDVRPAGSGEAGHFSLTFAFVEPDLVLLHARDITEHKAAERALSESEHRYRQLFNSIDDAILVYGKKGIFLDCNEALLRRYGYGREEFLRLEARAIVHPDYHGLMKKNQEKLWAGETLTVEAVHRRRNGTQFPVEIVARMLDYQGEQAIMAVVHDLTERRRAESALRESERRFRDLADSITDPFFALDSSLRCTYWNRASQELTGIKAADAIGKSIIDLFGGGDATMRAVNIYKDVLKDRKSRTFENEYAIKGKTYVFEISAYPTTGGIAVQAADITERKRLEARLRVSQRMEVLGSLAAGVAHEVRNPLNAIMSLTEALCLDVGDAPEHEQYLAHIRGQVDRLSRLMSDLLDLGKPADEAAMQEEFLSEICQSSVELWKQSHPDCGKAVGLDLPRDSGTTAVNADTARVQQVILNLLDNAAQHSQAGSEISVSLRTLETGIHCVCVKDRGPGIPEDRLEKVFEPFYTTQKKGTGLGLSIVRRIIENHGGSVVLYNNDPPPGCTVEIMLPAAGGVR